MLQRMILPLCLLAMLSATAHARVVRLLVDELNVHQDGDQVRVEARAVSEGGAPIGSYYIILVRTSLDRLPDLPGFEKSGQIAWLTSDDFDNPQGQADGERAGLGGIDIASIRNHHLPNGKLDEDPREDYFRVTIDTRGWPEGVYRFTFGVDARPRYNGARMHAERYFEVVIGDGADHPWPEIDNLAYAEHQVIYMAEGVYAAFPSLEVTRDGVLSTTFKTRVRATHRDETGGKKTLKSVDGGRTWIETDEKLVDRTWWTDDGRIVWPGLGPRVEVPNDQREALRREGKLVIDVRPGVIAYQNGAQVRISEDGGETWDTLHIPSPERVARFTSYLRAASFVNMHDGGILYALHGVRHLPGQPTRVPDGGEVFFIRGDPAVKNWECVPMYPDGVPDGAGLPDGLGLGEAALVEVEPGRLLAVMRRTDVPLSEMYQSVSTDGGRTWSRPKNTGVWGFPCHLLKLSDGRILMTYGYRRRPDLGIRAVISHDGGRTWDKDRTFILRRDGFWRLADLGYPITTELEDGTLFTIYYITTFESGGLTHIAGTHWTPRLESEP